MKVRASATQHSTIQTIRLFYCWNILLRDASHRKSQLFLSHNWILKLSVLVVHSRSNRIGSNSLIWLLVCLRWFCCFLQRSPLNVFNSSAHLPLPPPQLLLVIWLQYFAYFFADFRFFSFVLHDLFFLFHVLFFQTLVLSQNNTKRFNQIFNINFLLS